ncbi:MAG: cell division protein FtsX [Bacteroidales bacterium]|nr:cell division protein FtsX [Bacteroidales bacterium]
MAEQKMGNRRLRASYITSIISITLVLFMLGLLGMIILHGRKLSDYVRENISITILLKEDVSDDMILNFRQRLEHSGYVRTSRYITREEAAKELMKDLGEDFVQFIGYNPLPPTLDLQLKSEYANTDSIKKIEKKIMTNRIVKEVVYQKSLIDEVNSNIRKLTWIISGFSVILLLIAVILINNTIRLSVYARRFIIRSMQLVGATEAFIRWPFILRSMIHGLYAGVLSIVLLVLTLLLAQDRIPELKNLQDNTQFGLFFAAIIVIGILLSAVSTFFAVRRFLHMKSDSLYLN